MPNYVYRCTGCSGYFERLQKMSDPPVDSCPECGAPPVRVIQPVKVRIRHTMKDDMRDYRDDLARFAGDPEAYVDGPRSLSRLIDKRKREGWEISKTFEEPSSGPDKLRDSREVATEAFERARAKGFTPDDD